MSYLISRSWDGLTILVYILDTKRCYASVVIPRLEIGRAKMYCYFSFNDGAKIPLYNSLKIKMVSSVPSVKALDVAVPERGAVALGLPTVPLTLYLGCL